MISSTVDNKKVAEHWLLIACELTLSLLNLGLLRAEGTAVAVVTTAQFLPTRLWPQVPRHPI